MSDLSGTKPDPNCKECHGSVTKCKCLRKSTNTNDIEYDLFEDQDESGYWE